MPRLDLLELVLFPVKKAVRLLSILAINKERGYMSIGLGVSG